MATFNKFNAFVQDLGEELHNLPAADDVLKVYLSNELPLITDTVKTDIAEITAENGYPSGGTDIQNDWVGGVLTGTDVIFTASGGSFGPFRYVILYNDTSATKPLIGWWDYESSISVTDPETFTVDFGANILTIA
jgi:hypothetical protein